MLANAGDARLELKSSLFQFHLNARNTTLAQALSSLGYVELIRHYVITLS